MASIIISEYALGKLIGELPIITTEPDPPAGLTVTGERDDWLEVSLPKRYEWVGEGIVVTIGEWAIETALRDAERIVITNEGKMRIGPFRLQLIGRDPQREVVFAKRIEVDNGDQTPGG